MRTLSILCSAVLALAFAGGCGKSPPAGGSSGSTTAGTTAGNGSGSGSGSGTTGSAPSTCSACSRDADCAPGICYGGGDGGSGHCALPCDGGSCSAPNTKCSTFPSGFKGCYPQAEVGDPCLGFGGSSGSGSSGSTGH